MQSAECRRRRGSGLETLVDAVLPLPVIDRLRADVEVARDVGHRLAGDNEIKRATSELERVTRASHVLLLDRAACLISQSDSSEPAAHQ